MNQIKELISKANDFAGEILEPILQKIFDFLLKGEYVVVGIICVFLALVILIGLITWIKKTPKLFFFILIVFGGLAAAALFIK
jgi:hypothetical protein